MGVLNTPVNAPVSYETVAGEAILKNAGFYKKKYHMYYGIKTSNNPFLNLF